VSNRVIFNVEQTSLTSCFSTQPCCVLRCCYIPCHAHSYSNVGMWLFPLEVGVILQVCSMMSDGTVWGLALWALYQTEHRDGRSVPCIRLNSFRRCCQRLLGAGLTLSVWDLRQLLGCMVFSCWHMNGSFVAKVLLKFKEQEDVTADTHTASDVTSLAKCCVESNVE